MFYDMDDWWLIWQNFVMFCFPEKEKQFKKKEAEYISAKSQIVHLQHKLSALEISHKKERIELEHQIGNIQREKQVNSYSFLLSTTIIWKQEQKLD